MAGEAADGITSTNTSTTSVRIAWQSKLDNIGDAADGRENVQGPEAVTVLVAQLGARRHYAVPRILEAAGMLEGLYTDFVASKSAWKALAALAWCNGLLARMAARVPEGIPARKVTHWPRFAFEYNLRQRRAGSRAELTTVHLWAGREFCRWIIRHGLGNAAGVYTFNSAGLELLEHARSRGLFCVMDQTSAPAEVEDRLLAEVHSLFPDWEEPHNRDPRREEFAARERAEWMCADLILCGSEFVREGIKSSGGPLGRCLVVPYGFAVPSPAIPKTGTGSPLRVLMAGAVRVQKGAPYVLQAARLTKGLAHFRWVGRVALLEKAVANMRMYLDLVGGVPRPQMAEHYHWADVFLLPSICEGSATVCYEALAAGLPVITTPNAGSVVRDGVDGFIVPIRDAEAIAEKLELLTRDRELLHWMSANALARSREFTLEKYGERLITAISTAGNS